MKKILILGNSSLVVFGFRGELIEEFILNNYEVVVAFPNRPFGDGEKISRDYGCTFIEVPMNRHGMNPIEEIKLFRLYIKTIKKVMPDVVLAYTVKCDTYGGIACRLLNVPFLPNITGLGKGLVSGGITKWMTTNLYRISVKNAECVFFQNEEDKNFFLENGIKFSRSIVLPGSGVNLEKFHILPYPDSEKIIFTYIARVMKAKGIEQFLEAARTIKQRHVNTEFHICGYCEEDYKDTIKREESAGTVIYHGLVENVLDYERNSNCIVLPTFHPEGISNVLLEAAACGRPIITTNRPGCRETVDDGITGFLVRERDSGDLIEKMEEFLSLSREQQCRMGLAGRKKVESQFDRKIVVKAYLNEINNLRGEQ